MKSYHLHKVLMTAFPPLPAHPCNNNTLRVKMIVYMPETHLSGPELCQKPIYQGPNYARNPSIRARIMPETPLSEPQLCQKPIYQGPHLCQKPLYQGPNYARNPSIRGPIMPGTPLSGVQLC